MCMNRRDYLIKMMSLPLTGTAAGMFFSSFMNQAYGQMLGIEATDQNLLHLSMFGAPPRWLFDCPVRLNDSDPYTYNKQAITRLDASGAGIYETINYNGLKLPYLWGSSIPSRGGSSVPMSSLLENMMMVRGVNSGIDGHNVNRRMVDRPSSSENTMSSSLGELSSRPIPVVTTTTGSAYFSKKGLTRSTISLTGSPLEDWLRSFTAPSSLYLKNDQVENIVEQALLSLEKRIHKSNIKRRGLASERQNAKKLFRRSWGNLKDAYTSSFNKYRTLVDSVYKNPNYLIGEGVDSNYSPTINLFEKTSSNLYQTVSGTNLNIGADIRDAYRQANGFAQIRNLAEGLAIAEYVFSEKLSQSLYVGVSNAKFASTSVNGSSSTFSINNDAHQTGAVPTLVYFSKYYQALGACLSEFKQTMRAQKIFKDTTVLISSEFARTGRENGSGSDHGWAGNSFSILSGKIDNFSVVGNIKKQNYGSHKGSWGHGSHYEPLGGRAISPGDITSTIATLTGAKNPLSNATPLVYIENGKAKPIGGARCVA